MKIEGYKEGKLAFSDLVYDLEELVNILENRDEHWRKKFRDYWKDLEYTYAIYLDSERENFNYDEKICIENAVNKIEELIDFKLAELKQNLFDEYE